MPDSPTTAAVTGTVTYRQRVAVPPSTLVRVRLLDVSRAADAPAVVMAEHQFTTGGKQVPFAFKLAYDPALVTEKGVYAVDAEMRDDEGRLSFRTTQQYRVITGGAPATINLMLQST